MSKGKKIALSVLAVVVVGGVIAGSVARENRKKVQVQTGKVSRKDLVSKVSASGEIRPKKFVNVSSDVAGRIVHLLIKEGDRVKRGQIMARIDAKRYEEGARQSKASLAASRFDLDRALADLEHSRQSLERQKKMYQEKLVSDQVLEQSDSEFKEGEGPEGWRATPATATSPRRRTERKYSSTPRCIPASAPGATIPISPPGPNFKNRGMVAWNAMMRHHGKESCTPRSVPVNAPGATTPMRVLPPNISCGVETASARSATRTSTGCTFRERPGHNDEDSPGCPEGRERPFLPRLPLTPPVGHRPASREEPRSSAKVATRYGSHFLHRHIPGDPLNPREVPSPLINKPAPQFTLAQLAQPGQSFGPQDMRGQVWLLNVWASWCVACRQEHPLLVELARRKAVPIVGLNYKDKPDAAMGWLAQWGNPYDLSVKDLDGRVGIEYGVYGVPETFLIDKNGVIRFKQIGPITEEVWTKKMLPMIEELRRS